MREKDYVVIIGSANIDVAGYSHESLNYADSNPGKIKFTPGGVGRNIAQNLALLGNKALMNPLMILVKIIKLRWIHILSYDQM
ncbi:PfkB family carbohydrate kinase, partial [Escherichia coli]|uniref:PfkB family carbohydrate kinase n=1 Tax=Escherichia coli TaxID=562 RepID=UPI00200BC23A